MTLRLRLVIGLVVLVTAGLAIFGFSTYALYSDSEYDRLDDQLRSSVSVAAKALLDRGGFPAGPGDDVSSVVVPLGTYAELRTIDGELLVAGATSTDRPELPNPITDPGPDGRIVTTGSSVGRGEWRVSISRIGVIGIGDPVLVVVAIPTREVTESLGRLVLIEASAAAILLVILAVGSWLILRRGLRPLEDMATSTRSITAGSLSQRVEPSDGRTEVGQLGLAMNTMLDEIEQAFVQRDETERRLRQFLADASHELRTPLTSVQGFAELFRLGEGHPDLDLPVIMGRIEQEAGRMKVLVEDLLLLARLDEPQARQRVAVDLVVVAADACTDARVIALDRVMTLDGPEPVVVRADPEHLRQAVANLLTNAIRHTRTATAIEITVRQQDSQGVLQVRDHGAGLSDEALVHAFDRFWQADSARSGTGSGLGLAIVDSIARDHDGTASAANAPDGGAVFSLSIPLDVADSAIGGGGAAGPPASGR